MDNPKTDSYYIKKIHNDLTFICLHMNGVKIEELESNEILLDSMMFRLIQISETSRKLTDEYKKRNDIIPWNALYGLRNRIVHDYGSVDLTIIYETMIHDIPDVLALIQDHELNNINSSKL